MKLLFKPILFGFSFMFLSLSSFGEPTLQESYRDEAMKCDDLVCIRRNIDGLNDEILRLLVKRTAYVQRAGDIKIASKVVIANDIKRVSDTLSVLTKKSDQLGLPMDFVREIYQVIMQQSIALEQRYIDSRIVK